VRGNPTGKEKEMADLLTYGLVLVALIALAGLIYLIVAVNTTADDREEGRRPWPIPPWAEQMMEQMIPSRKKLPYQGVVKRGWLPTGRIDFAAQINADAKSSEQPSEFKLLVEERRIVESVAGNENLEIQWRLATLKEAKTVITQYHKYLSENSLIRSVSDDLAWPTTTQSSPSDSSVGTAGDQQRH
jgi:hypothetical protein